MVGGGEGGGGGGGGGGWWWCLTTVISWTLLTPRTRPHLPPPLPPTPLNSNNDDDCDSNRVTLNRNFVLSAMPDAIQNRATLNRILRFSCDSKDFTISPTFCF